MSGDGRLDLDELGGVLDHAAALDAPDRAEVLDDGRGRTWGERLEDAGITPWLRRHRVAVGSVAAVAVLASTGVVAFRTVVPAAAGSRAAGDDHARPPVALRLRRVRGGVRPGRDRPHGHVVAVGVRAQHGGRQQRGHLHDRAPVRPWRACEQRVAAAVAVRRRRRPGGSTGRRRRGRLLRSGRHRVGARRVHARGLAHRRSWSDDHAGAATARRRARLVDLPHGLLPADAGDVRSHPAVGHGQRRPGGARGERRRRREQHARPARRRWPSHISTA